MNPYHDQYFFGFLWQMMIRFFALVKGDIGMADLVSDEIQIIVLTGVAISSALVGSFLVLRRMTMLANALSHTILLGIVLAYMALQYGTFWTEAGTSLPIEAMLIAALITGFATSFLTEFLTKVVRLQEDASIGLVFTTLFALGIILVTIYTRDAHIGTEVVMGNADGLHRDDCRLVGWLALLNIVLCSVFFKEYAITTFDPPFARALGFSTLFFNYLLMAQVSLTVIGAFRAVGVLMVLAFLTGPALTARLLTHHLRTMLLLACGIGCVAAIIGVALSRHILSSQGIALTTGGVVVCVIILLYVVVACGILVRRRWEFA